ncbi:putative ATP-dependent RNA helicase TDRD12 [Chironomus tepperi]|uniref:putative ATP-dependent RNA helicase TDRD12 n=1 Tax=Chironomus tepperi TaxID=113505 RepID=UPI00391FC487
MDSRGTKVTTNFNSIYSMLFKNEEKTKESFQDILSKEVPLLQSERRIFVYGNNLQPRIVNFKDANFTEVIHNNLFKHGYRSIFPTQAHSWNEIINGRSVTIVNSRNSGKTMTYLPPLLSLLSNKSEIDEEISQGPIAIIITNTSREVELLYNICKQLLPSKDIKIVKAFGIWNFKDKCIELLNGCDLLITTPSCFTRFTECDTIKMFDRKRIKHLVIENVDMMQERFRTDLEVILKLCTKGTDLPQDNPQIIITATCWQDFLHLFSKLSTNPIIVIDAYIEAALFAKSRFTVSRKSLKEKDQQILNYLGQFEWRVHKTALIFTEQDEMDRFKALLRNRSLTFEILDGDTSENNMEAWNRLSKGKLTILLIHDSILTRKTIESIQILIHYSLPETWSAFSRRFALSLDYYKFYKDLPLKNKENQPRAIINMDENNVNEIPRIINFLSDRRLVQQIPAHIQNEAQRIKNDIEKAKTDADNEFIVPLCSNILKFASCSRNKCTLRHAFIPDDEPKFIPLSGKIKFKLIGMKSPLHLVVTITDYLAPNAVNWISYHDKIKAIKQGLKELQEYMSNDENQVIDVPKVGNLYAYFNSQTVKWQRCKLIKLEEKSDSISSQKASVEFIDVGGCSSVRTTSLLKLPNDIKMLDPLACSVRIVNLIPYDCDEIFDRETIDVVEKHIAKVQSKNDYMMCDIELAVGNTIITTNVTIHKKLNNINSDIMNLSMKKYLLENNFAMFKNVLDQLKDIAVSSNFYKPEEKIQKIEPVAEKPKEVKIEEQKSNLKDLQIGRTYKAALLSFENPESFYVQIIDNNLCDVKSKLKFIENHQTKELLKSYKKNTICLCKSNDGKVNRCVIIKNEPLEVFMVDFATKFKPKMSNLYEISNDLINLLPFQAIKCGIKGLKTKRMCTLGNILAYKHLFNQISKNGVFELTVHSKIADKFVVSAHNSDDDLDLKGLAIKQSLGNLTEEEAHEEKIKNETEYFMKLLENDDNVNLFQSDANKLLGLPSTARFLPPKRVQALLGESDNFPVKTVQKEVESVENVHSKQSIPEKNQNSSFKAPKIISLLKKANEKMKIQNVALIPEKVCEKIQEASKPIPENSDIKEMKLKNLFSNVDIEWNQNKGIVKLSIEAIDLLEYFLKITQTTCEICIKYADKIALRNFDFYGRVIPKYAVHKSNGRYITIFLIKKFSDVLWPRLTLSDEKNTNIKYSTDELKISFSEMDVNYQSKADGVPAGYYSDNEDNYFNEYDDNIEDDEDQV